MAKAPNPSPPMSRWAWRSRPAPPPSGRKAPGQVRGWKPASRPLPAALCGLARRGGQRQVRFIPAVVDPNLCRQPLGNSSPACGGGRVGGRLRASGSGGRSPARARHAERPSPNPSRKREGRQGAAAEHEFFFMHLGITPPGKRRQLRERTGLLPYNRRQQFAIVSGEHLAKLSTDANQTVGSSPEGSRSPRAIAIVRAFIRSYPVLSIFNVVMGSGSGAIASHGYHCPIIMRRERGDAPPYPVSRASRSKAAARTPLV